jgi:hypothetical protein
MGTFTGDTTAATLDRRAAECHAHGHAGDGQDYDDEARDIQHYLISVP